MVVYGAASFDSLFKRCVQGCPKATPDCPTCPSDQVCSLVPPTCDECQKTVCVPSSSAASTQPSTNTKSGSGVNSGAIAGGVIGGVVAIAIVTYLVWRFCIKNKRQQYEAEDWVEDHEESQPVEKDDFAMRRDARASTHTVGSIASTVLTRASNIIQIAYIPGVTNRSTPSTPGLLVPPVPPIPIALSSSATTPRYEQEHFFMPGDLRDSTYSGISDRTSYARNSVASTIYGKNAVVSPIPAQTVMRGKAAVVSVRTNGGGSPGDLTPPVPNVDYSRYGNREPPSPAFSVGSTFLNSASAATQMRPQVIRVASVKKKDPSHGSNANSGQHESLLPRESYATTILDDTPTLRQGPFSDKQAVRKQSGSSLGDAANKSATGSEGRRTGQTPFGDENEVREA